MKLTLILFSLLLSINLFAQNNIEAYSQARVQEKEEKELRGAKCLELKSALAATTYPCEEDSVLLTEANYTSYLANGRVFNYCENSTNLTIEKRAEMDAANSFCMKQAEARNPELAHKLSEKYLNAEVLAIIFKFIGATIIALSLLGIIVFFVLITPL